MKKESSWNECLEYNSSIKISPDIAKVKSLIDTTKGRNDYLAENKVKESSANYIFESYYSSLLELLHAFILLEGYKVTNHICLGYYLRDKFKRNDLYRQFDDCR